MGTFASTGSAQVTLAGVQNFILNDTGWDRGALAIGVTAGTWTAGFLTPLFGRIADTKGPRVSMPLAAILIGLCFYFIAGVSSLWQFYVAYIIARGIGTPVLISVIPRTVAVNFFLRKRNLALGLISMARFAATKVPEEINWTSSEALKTKALWLIGMSQFLIILTLGTMGFQLVPFLNDLGMSLSLAATAWSITSLLDSFSHPFWGFMSDRHSPRRLIFIALPSAIFAAAIFLLIDDKTLAFGLVLVWGTVSGGLEVLGGMLLASYYGRNSYGTISGIVGPFQIIGLGLGPSLGALLHKLSSGYDSLFVFSVAAYVVATALIYAAKKPEKNDI